MKWLWAWPDFPQGQDHLCTRQFVWSVSKENIQGSGRYCLYIISSHLKKNGNQDCFAQDVPTNTVVSLMHKMGLLTQVTLPAEVSLPQSKPVILVALKSAATGGRKVYVTPGAVSVNLPAGFLWELEWLCGVLCVSCTGVELNVKLQIFEQKLVSLIISILIKEMF